MNKKAVEVLIFLLVISYLLAGCAGKKILLGEKPPSEEISLQRNPSMPPREALNHYIKALGYEDNQFYQGAVIEYRKALRYDPDSFVLHFGAGRNYYSMDMFDSASVEFERALAIEADNAQGLEYLGKTYIKTGNYENALQIFTDMKEAYPQEKGYSIYLAAIYLETNCPDKALDVLYALAEESEDRLEALEQAAAVMIVNDHYSLAVKVFLRIIDEFPDYAEAPYRLGSLYLEMEESDSALSCFRAAITLDSLNLISYLSAAYILNRQKALEEAAGLLRSGINNIPDEPDLYNFLGSILYRMEQSEEAIITLKKSISLDSTDASPYVTLGLIYDEMGDLNKALEIYEIALKIDSTNATVLNNYAYILSEANIRLEEALEMSAKSLEARPGEPSYLDTMGWILYRLKDYTEAEKYLRKAIEIEPSPVMFLHLGDVLREAGKEERAIKAYQQGLEMFPDDQDLLQRLEGR